MSGDVSLENEPVIFYSPDMTVTKMIVLKHKGIKFKLYSKVINKIDKLIFLAAFSELKSSLFMAKIGPIFFIILPAT